jgi:hypothetical protein
VADTGSLVGMAWATGPMAQVVNIGLEVMKFSIPRNTTVSDFFESVKHKVCLISLFGYIPQPRITYIY